MKTIGFIALPILCAVGAAMADDMGKEGAADKMEAAAAPAKAPAQYRMAAQGTKRLPSGDIRHCLALRTNEAIIRCSETRRRK